MARAATPALSATTCRPASEDSEHSLLACSRDVRQVASSLLHALQSLGPKLKLGPEYRLMPWTAACELSKELDAARDMIQELEGALSKDM